MKSKTTLYKYVGMNSSLPDPLLHIRDTIQSSHMWMDSGSNFNDPFDVAYTENGTLRKVKALHVLCLTNSYGKKLMWSHYASNHTGICYTIEVDRDLVYPVCYTTKRVVIDKDDPEEADDKEIKHLDEILKNNKAKPKRNLVKDYSDLSISKKIAFVKDSKWIDEREYRIVLDDGDKGLTDVVDDGYFFNGIRIINIYLGTRFGENKKDVQDELIDLCRRFHISVKQMEYGTEKYEVKTGKTIL